MAVQVQYIQYKENNTRGSPICLTGGGRLVITVLVLSRCFFPPGFAPQYSSSSSSQLKIFFFLFSSASNLFLFYINYFSQAECLFVRKETGVCKTLSRFLFYYILTQHSPPAFGPPLLPSLLSDLSLLCFFSPGLTSAHYLILPTYHPETN